MHFIHSLFLLLTCGLLSLGAVIEPRDDVCVDKASHKQGIYTTGVACCISISAVGKVSGGSSGGRWEKVLAHIGATQQEEVLAEFQGEVIARGFAQNTLYIKIGKLGPNWVAAEMQSDPEFLASLLAMGDNNGARMQQTLNDLAASTEKWARETVRANGGRASRAVNVYQRLDSDTGNAAFGAHVVRANGIVEIDGHQVHGRAY